MRERKQKQILPSGLECDSQHTDKLTNQEDFVIATKLKNGQSILIFCGLASHYG